MYNIFFVRSVFRLTNIHVQTERNRDVMYVQRKLSVRVKETKQPARISIFFLIETMTSRFRLTCLSEQYKRLLACLFLINLLGLFEHLTIVAKLFWAASHMRKT